MDTELQSFSDLSEESGNNVRNPSGVILFQDNRNWKLTKEVLTPLKLQVSPQMCRHSEPDMLVKAGEVLEMFRVWHNCVQNWLSMSSENVVTLQGTEWTLPVAGRSVAEITQLQTYYLQEMKKYVDKKLSELWQKLRDIWNGNLEYARNTSQVQDKLVADFQELFRFVRNLFLEMQKLVQHDVPDIICQTNKSLHNSSDSICLCMSQQETKIQELVTVVQKIIPELHQLGMKVDHTVQRIFGLEQRSLVPVDVVPQDLDDTVRGNLGHLNHVVNTLNGKIGGLKLNQRFKQLDLLQGTVTQFMQEMSHRVQVLETHQVGTQESGAGHGEPSVNDDAVWMKDVLDRVLLKVDELSQQSMYFQDALDNCYFRIQSLENQNQKLEEENKKLLSVLHKGTGNVELQGLSSLPLVPECRDSSGFCFGSPCSVGQQSGNYTPGHMLEGGIRLLHSQHVPPSVSEDRPHPPGNLFIPQGQAMISSSGNRAPSGLEAMGPGSSSLAPDNQVTDPFRMSAPVREPVVNPEDCRFNPTLHGMVSEALGFSAWNGDWMESDDWFLTWKLYTHTTFLPPKPKAVIFISKMPETFSVFLRNKHLREDWSVEEMMAWLRTERRNRVPLHVRHKAWQQLLPEGNSYQQFVNWFTKWQERLQDLEVTEMQVLDQFDLNIQKHFAVPLTELLKKEQELKTRDPTAKLDLQQRYEFICRAVVVSDNVKALCNNRTPSVSSSSHRSPQRTSGYPRWGRNVEMRSVSDNSCFYCKKSGHWISRCPDREANNKKANRCLNCGKSDHWSKGCPRKKDRRSSGSSTGTSASSGLSARNKFSKNVETRSVQKSGKESEKPRSDRKGIRSPSAGYSVHRRSRSPSYRKRSSSSGHSSERSKGKSKIRIAEVDSDTERNESSGRDQVSRKKKMSDAGVTADPGDPSGHHSQKH